MDDLEGYCDEIYRLKKKYEDRIEILLGMEVDYIPDKMGPTADFLQTAGLDYTVGSIHFVDSFKSGKGWEIDGPLDVFKKGLHEIFGGNVEAAVRRYYELTREMIVEDCPEIVGHLDKIKMQNVREHFFSEDEKWYRDEVMNTLEVISKARTHRCSRGLKRRWSLISMRSVSAMEGPPGARGLHSLRSAAARVADFLRTC